MADLFKAKVRKIGTSLGVIMPKEMIAQSNIKEGEEVEITVLKRDRKIIADSFGIDRGKIKFPFIRDKSNRDDKYK